MKLLVVFASLILAIAAVSDEEAWAEYKQEFSKQYRSLREDKLRYEIFKSNLVTIKEHNARYENGEETYTMGINQFSDLTDEEFAEQYLSYEPIETNFTEKFEVPEDFTAPDSVDWRGKAVLSVKDQGQCGSCWSFSAIGAVEGQNALKHNAKSDLSEQELVDCDISRNKGCSGGSMVLAFEYIKSNGISSLKDYPYVAKQNKCTKTSHPRSSVKVTGYKGVNIGESNLQAAVASVGPISVGIAADKIKSYSGGVFDNILCGLKLNHGVLAVGYGTASNKQFWLVKNSWGTKWGEQGYIRMSRNKLNQCGIALMASYPVLA